jgi:hypothetical protein
LKKNSSKLGYRVSKGAEFGKMEKNVHRKTEFLGIWKILQRLVFMRKKFWELLDAKVLHIFEISAKFCFF